jgi:uncharacterized membrane protein
MPQALGKNRIEALGDGIFAIAMTLLVLELHVPDLPASASNTQVAPALLKLWPNFTTYAASFLSLGVFWVAHHAIYHNIRRADRVLLCLNLLFFMLASFLPFATSVLNAFRQTQVAPLFFGMNIALIGWCLGLQWVYACRQEGMLASHASEEYGRAIRFRLLVIPTALTLTALICFWSVEISVAVFLMLMPLYLLPVPRRTARATPDPERAHYADHGAREPAL